MYQLTVETLFVEAAALVGFLVGLLYDRWIAVVVAPGLLMVCEDGGDQVAESGRTAAANTTARPNHRGKGGFPPWLYTPIERHDIAGPTARLYDCETSLLRG